MIRFVYFVRVCVCVCVFFKVQGSTIHRHQCKDEIQAAVSSVYSGCHGFKVTQVFDDLPSSGPLEFDAHLITFEF